MNSPAVAWWCADATNEHRQEYLSPSTQSETMEPESPSVASMTNSEILAQRAIQRLVGDQQVIVDPCASCSATQLFNVSIHLAAIFIKRVLRNHFESLVCLQIHQDRRRTQIRLYLLRIKNMKQHHLIAMEAQRVDRPHDCLGAFIEIRDDNHDSTPMQKLLKM